MIFLIDYNLNGHALVFFGCIVNQGWLDLMPIRFVTFAQMELSTNSDDRTVWRFAQENEMILLTANRSMKGKNSLEQVMREENSPNSLPVITIGNADRLLNDSEYRELCAERLIEIILALENYRGSMRIFIP